MAYTEFINPLIRHIGFFIEYIGLFLVIGSVAIALLKLVAKKGSMEQIQKELAKRIIFGLEFVIAADILLATVTVSLNEIYRLAGIVIIRVILGYSLRKEIGLK